MIFFSEYRYAVAFSVCVGLFVLVLSFLMPQVSAQDIRGEVFVPGGIVEYTERGQHFNFRKIGEGELMLMPGDYSGDVVIPAGFRVQDRIYTVTAIGPEALTGSGLKSVVVPHTVTTLDVPLGWYNSEPAPLDSIKFLSRPLHFNGIITYNALAAQKERNQMKRGDTIVVRNESFVVEEVLSYPHFLVLRSEKNGKLGIATYENIVLPPEYEDFHSVHSYAAVLKKDGKWGVVDFMGNVLIPFKYASADKLGFGRKFEKKIDKAFAKFYMDDAEISSKMIRLMCSDAEISYLMRLVGYEYERPETKGEDAFLFHVSEIFRGKESRTHKIDSLINYKNFSEAKSHYRKYIRNSGFSAKIEEKFAEAGCMTYTLRDTVDMDWLGGEYSGLVDEFGLPHGYGKLCRDVYYEDSLGNLLLGDSGEYYTSDIYEGMWIKGKIFGTSTMKRYEILDDYTSGIDTLNCVFDFSGYLVGNKIYGQADMTYPIDSDESVYINKYSGEVSDWKRNGRGTAWFNDGSIYEGDWKNDLRDGYGKRSFSNGNYLDGKFAQGKFVSGYGKVGTADGSIYEGEFCKGLMKLDGKGKLTNPDGGWKEGTFADGGFISGTVEIHYNDGIVYSGGWSDGKCNGRGKYIYPDGGVLEGNFKDGEPHGKLFLTDPDGSRYERIFGSAEYLTIDGETEKLEHISHYSKSRTYAVDTDWGDYEISSLPDWITVNSKTATSLTLNIASNSYVDRRSVIIYIKAGGKSAKIDITQDGDKYAKTGKIESSKIVYDVIRNAGLYMMQGMEIHSKFFVDNLKGMQCQVSVYFEFSNGQKLRDGNRRYYTTDGYVSVWENFKPLYTSTVYNDYTLFIPYGELHLAPGQHQLRYCVKIFDMSSGNVIAESDYFYFSLTIW